MKRFLFHTFAALAVTLAVAGCAGTIDRVGTAYSVLTEIRVSREAVVLARNAFNAAEVTATNYLSLRRCNGSNGPVCRDPALRKPIVAAVLAGRAARNDLTRFMREHPNELGPSGLYDALTSATSTINVVTTTYQANR